MAVLQETGAGLRSRPGSGAATPPSCPGPCSVPQLTLTLPRLPSSQASQRLQLHELPESTVGKDLGDHRGVVGREPSTGAENGFGVCSVLGL